nr:uncharacterized protein LOC107436439 [Parasteatoda tepidariorum]
MVHPAHKTSHKYTNLPTSTRTSKTTTVEIYTDGSKTDNGMGAAFCVYHNNQHTDTYKFTLKQESTVFQAEVLAIKEATNWLETHSCKDATILKNNLASIHAIRKTELKDLHVATTQRQLEHLVRKCSTQIHWVAAHTGNIGNEAADLAAKDAAAGHGIPSGVLLPPSSLRNKHKNMTQKLRQAYWEESEKGYTTKFPSFLHRMQRINTDTCPCDDTGTPSHYLHDCPLIESYHLKKPNEQGRKIFADSFKSKHIMQKLINILAITRNITDNMS